MEAKLEGNKLTVVIPVTAGTTSSSGKSLVVATTSGFVAVPGTDLRISINVIKARKGE
jgi:hypothetical protein